ncbi:MAG: hypothetical protein ABW360_08520 [Phenylobacterium sp.]
MPAGVPPQSNSFDALVRYIPTETITLFVASMAARATLSSELQAQFSPWVFYWAFALLTPVIFLLLAYIKHRETGAPPPFRPHPWPPTAAFIAFVVWALSIPGVLAPATAEQWGAFTAFGALSVSMILSLVDRLVGLPRPVP